MGCLGIAEVLVGEVVEDVHVVEWRWQCRKGKGVVVAVQEIDQGGV